MTAQLTRQLKAALLAAILLTTSSIASVVRAETIVEDDGVTNPEELSISSYFYKLAPAISRGRYGACNLGHAAIISGQYNDAVNIFKLCAESGNQASKIWMSYIYQNGLGVEKDPVASTNWVKESAEDGYSIGQFNYGLALIKGYGVKRDMNAGKVQIDKAATQGDTSAIEMQNSDYDPDVVTPDAEEPDKIPAF